MSATPTPVASISATPAPAAPQRLPTYFVSHAGPDILLNDTPGRTFLEGMSAAMGRPRAIVVASAHFMTRQPAVVHDAKPGMIYDFGGFPEELYHIVYPAPGEPAVAEKVAHLLQDAGLNPALVEGRGFDHGTWVPMRMIYPDAGIPVVQLAVQPYETPEHHYKLGRALQHLSDEDILVFGSGAATHNLQAFFRGGYGLDHPVLKWVEDFSEWLNDKVCAGDVDALFDYRNKAPYAAENHPTDEHLMPLFVALGAAGDGAKGTRLHTSVQNGVLAMDAFAFAA